MKFSKIFSKKTVFRGLVSLLLAIPSCRNHQHKETDYKNIESYAPEQFSMPVQTPAIQIFPATTETLYFERKENIQLEDGTVLGLYGPSEKNNPNNFIKLNNFGEK